MNKTISAIAIAVFAIAMISAVTQARAQILPLTETNLPAGVYVVTKEGFWPIAAWIAAHPGKSIPQSLVSIAEPIQTQAPHVTVKSSTKTIHEHDDNHHFHFKFKHRDHEHGGDEGGGHDHGPGQGGGSSGSGGGSSSGGSAP